MGCLAKIAIPKPKQIKICPKIVDCIFIEVMHKIVSHINSLHMNKKFRVYTRIRWWNQGTYYSLKMYFFIEILGDQVHQNLDYDSHHEFEPRHDRRIRVEKSSRNNSITYLWEKKLQTYEEIITSSEWPPQEGAINIKIDSNL